MESYRDIIREQRGFKDTEQDRSLTGYLGKDKDYLYDRLDRNVEFLQEQNREFLEKYIDPLFNQDEGYLRQISKDSAFKVYKSGLESYLKLHYRANSRDELLSDIYIRRFIIGYTNDFLMNLKISENIDLSPSVGLEIAGLSYRNDPRLLFEIMKKYPNLDKYIIRYAVVDHPCDSIGFIEKIISNQNILHEMYPDLPLCVINTASIDHINNSVEFIDQLLEQLMIFHEKYPEVDESLFIRALLSFYKDPETFILRVLENIERLKIEKPESGIHQIKKDAQHNLYI